MTWRSAHGRARELGRQLVSECPPTDELRPATPALPDRPDRTADGRFAPGNRLARQAKARAGVGGALAVLDAKADPAWQAARRWARRGMVHRIAELTHLHGGELTAGVCALVADEWDMRGDARYIAARARADGDAELSRVAASLLAGARQAARDAWQTAALESDERKKAANTIDRWRRPRPEEPKP